MGLCRWLAGSCFKGDLCWQKPFYSKEKCRFYSACNVTSYIRRANLLSLQKYCKSVC